MHRPRRLALAAVVLAAASPARAQDAAGSAFSVQTFRPAVDSKGYVTVDASQLLGHLDFSLGLVTSYAHDVLHLSKDGRSFVVEHLLTPQLQGALGLWKRLELGLSLPVHIMAGGRGPRFVEPADHNLDNDLRFSGQSVGDLGLHMKARLLDTSRSFVGLGALVSVYAPTGRASQFLGEGQVTLRPELIVDKEFGRARRFRLALNVGALVRPQAHAFTDRGTILGGDPHVAGGMPFCAPSSLAPGASSTCGTGLGRALGTQLTYGLGAAYAVVPQKLELVGEAFGYADVGGNATGSPLEGLLAAKVYLASKSYFEIGGGAGLLPSTITRQGGMTGAPQLRVFVGFVFEPAIGDRDGDGIKDDVDKCPDEPEDFDGFEDEDGCPDPDNDNDGLLDRDDQCPNQPGPESNHGCPIIDSDGDGLADKDDECPRQAGPRDNQGCPLTSVTRLRGGKLVLLEPIFFETARAIIMPVSFSTLDDVAESMQANQQLLLVEIQGHADERGNDDFNLKLTEARAAAVKDYLEGKGVAAGRLRARGYGETRPLCREHDESCWSRNRRVEFVIIERSDGKR